MVEFEKQLDPNMPAFLKKIAMDRHKTVLEGGAGTGGGASSRDNFRSLETALLPDGSYLLRVSASDSSSNPSDPITTIAVSEPIIICNALPTLLISGKPEVHADRSVAIHGTAVQKLAAVVAVQYRIDAGDWVAATPDDGLFDSGREVFQFVTAPLTGGKHNIEVLCFNSAGEHSSTKVDVVVP